MTGDIATETLRSVTAHDFVHLSKPVKLEELRQVIQRLLPPSRFSSPAQQPSQTEPTPAPCVFIVDHDAQVCDATRSVLADAGFSVESFCSAEAFLASFRLAGAQCVLIDAYRPGMSGLQLLKRLHDDGHHPQCIVITGQSDVPIAAQAMKAGAVDFIEKPIGRTDLLEAIERALEHAVDSGKRIMWQEMAAGHAAELRISQRTVENHRASIMRKTGATSLPALARPALAATATRDDRAP